MGERRPLEDLGLSVECVLEHDTFTHSSGTRT